MADPKRIITLSEVEDSLYLHEKLEYRPDSDHTVADLVQAMHTALILDEGQTKGGGASFLKSKDAPQEVIDAWEHAEQDGRVHFMNSWGDTSEKELVARDFLQFLERNGVVVSDEARTYLFKNQRHPSYIIQWVAAAMDAGMTSATYSHLGSGYVSLLICSFKIQVACL